MKTIGQIFREILANDVKKGINKNNNVFVLSYSKLSSAQICDLRKMLKKSGAQVYVSKNTIARIALQDLNFQELADKIDNQTAFIWSNADAVDIAKAIIKFVKDFDVVKVQGGLLQGRVLNHDDVKRLSDLPSREVLLSQLLGTIQAPLSRLANALNAKTRDLLSILKQLSEKKGGK
ncbi:MAG TPA: 50S ribosomal protein L10 [Candidatus Omnitrophota bacterium]|nr:50S ribosomal protein L10 [Candidatus Omnitrophota bacterium]